MDCRRRATPGVHSGSAALLERCGRMRAAARGVRRLRWTVRRETLGGCLGSARAGQRSPRDCIAT
eukprot:1000993-Prymnesium_polylepis.1